MVAVTVGQLCPDGACKGTRQLIVVFACCCWWKWVVLGGFGISVGTASCVFGWLRLAADNADDDDDDDEAYDTKNGVNAPFYHQPPP
eukprot:14499431-Ditylum_brightwellii.AAC.1